MFRIFIRGGNKCYKHLVQMSFSVDMLATVPTSLLIMHPRWLWLGRQTTKTHQLCKCTALHVSWLWTECRLYICICNGFLVPGKLGSLHVILGWWCVPRMYLTALLLCISVCVLKDRKNQKSVHVSLWGTSASMMYWTQFPYVVWWNVFFLIVP